MSKDLIINASLPEIRIALIEEGQIQELYVERQGDQGIVGNIYKGKVTRVLPGMQAAFVDIGMEKAAFLYVDDVYVHGKIPSFDEESAMSGSDRDRDRDEDDEDDEQGPEESQESLEASEAELAEGTSAESSADSADAAADSIDFRAENDDIEMESEESEEGEETDSDDDDTDSFSSQDLMGASPSESSNETVSENAGADTVEEDTEKTLILDEASLSSAPPDPNATPGSPSDTPAPKGVIIPRSQTGGAVITPRTGSSEESPIRFQQSHTRGRRGRRGGRGRDRFRGRRDGQAGSESVPKNFKEAVDDQGDLETDRSLLDNSTEEATPAAGGSDWQEASQRPSNRFRGRRRPEFRQRRGRDRRVRTRNATRPWKSPVNIQDLLKEGQEVIVQVAKDAIATKGARLTCHVSLPGRHLVCMPTIDHVGVSRRIEFDSERRKLRQFVEERRPQGVGFIVRTASEGTDPERWIAQDIDYLTKLWKEIRENAEKAQAPALVYQDLNSVVRAVRDWVSGDLNKIIVDSSDYFNQIRDFSDQFMPTLRDRVELYHGHVPIFDAYSISTELHRALERKVWLKSGGYIVIDQAEALVAIDVNTGRYVGKKNLEDTILKTNLEAVEEVAYQLRLRNCGGIIIIDLIDMEKEESRMRVYRALESAIQKDRARPIIVRMTDLGLIEMTRKRTRDTLVRALCQTCAHCEGRGFVKSKETVAYEILREIERAGIDREIRRILVQAHPSVIDVLAIDLSETLGQLERRYRKQILLQAIMDFHDEQFEVTGDRPLNINNNNNNNASQNRGNFRSTYRRSDESNEASGVSSGQNGEGSGAIVPKPKIISPRIIAPVTSAPSSEEGGITPTSGLENAGSGEEVAVISSVRPKRDGNPRGDEESAEEDRLAFLRAQAAQDAALASYGASSGNVQGGDAAGGHAKRNVKGRSGRNNNNNNSRKPRRNSRRNGHFFRNRNHRKGFGMGNGSGGGKRPIEVGSSNQDSGGGTSETSSADEKGNDR